MLAVSAAETTENTEQAFNTETRTRSVATLADLLDYWPAADACLLPRTDRPENLRVSVSPC